MSAVVLDASVLAELLVGSSVGAAAHALIRQTGDDLHIPHLAVVETASVLRAWVRGSEVPDSRAVAALADLGAFPARRWPTDFLLRRIWELRDNLSAYDACYVALAEVLGAVLLTADRRLARGASSFTDVAIEVV